MAQAKGVTLPRQAIIPAAAAMRVARKHHADNKGRAPAQDLSRRAAGQVECAGTEGGRMISALVAAGTVVLVVPPAPHGDAPEWASFAAQSGQSTWISLKQLDFVLRRRDLRLADVSDPEIALPLARTLGATDVVVGSLRRVSGHYYLTGERINVATRKVGLTYAGEGSEPELPAMAASLAQAVLGMKGMPMETNAHALRSAALCGMELVGYPLHPSLGKPQPLQGANSVENDCRAALQADPQFGYARAFLAVLLALKGQTAEAIKEATEARKDRFVAMAWLAESFAARVAGDEAASRRALEEAVKQRPGFLLALGYLGEDRMAEMDFKTALAIWDKYLARAPDHPFALGQKGHALARLNRMTESLATTQRALAIDPGDAELLIELASRQIDAGRDKDAEGTLLQALQVYPQRPLAKLRLGFLYLRQKRVRDARDVLHEAITEAWREDEARTRSVAFTDLARVAALEGKFDEVVEYLSAAKAEGFAIQRPCDEPELKPFHGKPEFDSLCAGGKP
jgi:tetratricopeptide (TPR) repeat protein